MKESSMVKITPLQQIGSDDRGGTFVFDNERTGQLIVAQRKAGSISGGNYHTGKHPYKVPEILVIMQGNCTLRWKDIHSENHGTETVIGPAQIVIPPNIWHELKGETDFVMLEMNGLDAGQGDTFNL